MRLRIARLPCGRKLGVPSICRLCEHSISSILIVDFVIRISSSTRGEATIIQVNGRIDAVTAPEFEQACLELVGCVEHIVVFDFCSVQYISSAGLRSLLVIGKALQEGGGTLRFANVTGAVGQVFELSGFYSLFQCFDSVEKAAR